MYDNPMKISEAAYIAGFIDGEGCIGIGWTRSRHNAKKRYRKLSLQITQTEREPLDFVVEKLGVGKVYGPHIRQAGELGTKPRYTYSLRRQPEIVRVLRLLLPYFIVKRARAEAAIAAYGDAPEYDE